MRSRVLDMGRGSVGVGCGSRSQMMNFAHGALFMLRVYLG
jgi:hypothetical protein